MQAEPEKILPSAWPRGSQGCWFPRRCRDRDAWRSTREARKIHPDTGFSVAVILIELGVFFFGGELPKSASVVESIIAFAEKMGLCTHRAPTGQLTNTYKSSSGEYNTVF